LGGQVLRTNPSATGTEWFTLAGGGSVTSVTSSVGDGVTINITNPSTTPNLTVDLGAITPTSVNGLIITPTSYTLNVPANATVYGINTGDQLNVIGNSGSTSTVAISDDTSTNADHYLFFLFSYFWKSISRGVFHKIYSKSFKWLDGIKRITNFRSIRFMVQWIFFW
jgi:hypothetical protein